MGVVVGRLLPGTRVYTNLVAGAVGMPPLTFVAGLVPSSLVWLAIFTGLGYALGQRAAAYLHQAETLILLLAVQFILVVGLLYGLRRIRPPQAVRTSSRARLLLAVGIDLVVVSVIAATLRLVILPRGIGVTLAVVVSAVLYVLSARVAAGSTAGERLLEVSYAGRP